MSNLSLQINSPLSLQINSPAHLVGIIQSLATGSFDKKYANQDMAVVVSAFAFATQDLSQEQIVLGVKTVLEMGYCPDAALFRRWCLGQKDFDNKDFIADSYIGKHGALASITRWLETDGQTPISIAEKYAFDETYSLWQNIHSQSDRSRAELAFKDYYTKIVADLVKARIACQTYIAPVAICQSEKQEQIRVCTPDEAKSHLDKLKAMLKQKTSTIITQVA